MLQGNFEISLNTNWSKVGDHKVVTAELYGNKRNIFSAIKQTIQVSRNVQWKIERRMCGPCDAQSSISSPVVENRGQNKEA